jgi:hypothetical protein
MSVSNIDIEQTFSDFIEEYGGVVSDRVPTKGNKPPNADYIFHHEKVVAELKILKEEPFQNKEFRKSLEKKTNEWLQKRYITPYQLSCVTQVNQLPDRCYQDALKLYGRSIQTHIDKANNQIKRTKEHLSLSDYKGLLFLASDGNYFHQPRHVRFFVANILNTTNYNRSINTVVYFTVNMITVRSGDPTLSRLWMALYRDGFEKVSPEFTNDLFDKWVDYFSKLTGIALKKIRDINEEGLSAKDHLPETKFIKLQE